MKVRAETEQVTAAAVNISSSSFSEPAAKAATPLTSEPIPPSSFSTSSPATPCTPLRAVKDAQVEQAGNILEDPKASETSTAEKAFSPLPPCLPGDRVSLAAAQQHARAEQQDLHQPPHPEEVVHDAAGTKYDKTNSNTVTSTTSDPASSDVKADFEKLLDEVFNRYEERLSEALTRGITKGFKEWRTTSIVNIPLSCVCSHGDADTRIPLARSFSPSYLGVFPPGLIVCVLCRDTLYYTM